MQQTEVPLKRTLSLPLIVLYGLGTTIGAGIYALTGEVAGRAGMLAPWAFLLACLLAAFTALSFAEMASRYPFSAGEAVYVREGLGLPLLATLVGLLVAMAGCVASATIVNGFIGYLERFIDLPPVLTIVLLSLLLAIIAAWGITESVITAALFTLLEVGGLLIIIWVARDGFMELPQRLPELLPLDGIGQWQGVLVATLLAFYAFLGFEDMVNVAEEVKSVERTLPLGIVITLLVTALIYILLAMAAVLTVPPEELGMSKAPLALVYERNTGSPATAISAIALVAIINGALIQIIMASRVIYGLSRQGSLPRLLSFIHPRTRTPLVATALITSVVMTFALWFPLAQLAEATSLITLTVFSLVNLALWRLKARHVQVDAAVWSVPRWVPLSGFTVSAGMVLYGVLHFIRQ